jgi:hypothetical protein
VELGGPNGKNKKHSVKPAICSWGYFYHPGGYYLGGSMNHPRRKKKIDSNQPLIVKQLLSIPGMSVAVGYDDIICGYKKVTLWCEIKTEDCYSKKTGELLNSCKKDSQKLLDKTFTGARIYACCSEDILKWFGIIK